ncbi:MAG TPA: 2-oxoacid:acceptor oxidoreductase family protein [Burkholderiales bacterium]|nr:2-oxoacid:acceptor oxidoreductase family protein [Burkholderiales bacterium]
MYRIRFHGRGGQGIKTASQMLGTALFLEGYEVQDAPRYGAERRGAPIFAYVRAARAPIQERGVITRPDLVVVADETLVPVPAAGVLQGISERTVLLIQSAEAPEEWRQRLKLRGPILNLPLAAEIAESPLVGAACAGAAARLLGVIRRHSLERSIRDEIGKLGASAVRSNLEQALATYDAMAEHAGVVSEGLAVTAADYSPPEWVDLPFEGARLSAPDISSPASSELVNTGAWRTHRPVIDYELCNRCSWVCSTLCPDSAIRVGPDHTPHIDYDHCKGCMLCVTVCPPHAIRAEPETARGTQGPVPEPGAARTQAPASERTPR